ncbi:MAG TPA: hypothetical protein VGE45_16350 [Chloroflexia bacterium]|jgi:hypothetical protein
MNSPIQVLTLDALLHDAEIKMSHWGGTFKQDQRVNQVAEEQGALDIQDFLSQFRRGKYFQRFRL